VYIHYHRSGKKRHGLEVIANTLGESLLKIGGTHGIRWAASQARTIKAVMTDLPTVVADLELTAKDELGVLFSLLTPSNNFIGKSFMQKWEGYRNMFKAVVRKLILSIDGISANDSFELFYSDGKKMTMPKAELVAALTSNDDHDRLDNHV
jgi:hypothetical protein